MEKKDLIEKLKKMTPEERALFRESLQEAEPGAFLSAEEMSKVREMLAGNNSSKTKPKEKGLIESIFGS